MFVNLRYFSKCQISSLSFSIFNPLCASYPSQITTNSWRWKLLALLRSGKYILFYYGIGSTLCSSDDWFSLQSPTIIIIIWMGLTLQYSLEIQLDTSQAALGRSSTRNRTKEIFIYLYKRKTKKGNSFSHFSFILQKFHSRENKWPLIYGHERHCGCQNASFWV